ncbi:MAG: glycoside hydrolase family 43 protein [Lacrimispora sphenoides]
MKTIKNPILKGFNPDPSIIRVGDDYYIATSTFEWFPGVQIHHSKDLIHWKLIAHPLKRLTQLNMLGEDSSCGVWAPCLSYHNNKYYLVYSDVKAHLYDVHNYLVTADEITGDWSEPIALHGLGFDASLFHDDDGRKWLVSMISDSRKGKSLFGGIVLQEYSEEQKKLIGSYTNIFKGTELGTTEGPHIYKRNGYYYLLTAVGGTGLRHAVTIARSRFIQGPYEVCPDNPILTARYAPENPLQKAGHADIVETQSGDWYMVHLCSRPIARKGRCILGRETAIQKIEWTEDGWIRLSGGGNQPFLEVAAPALPECEWSGLPSRDDFNSEELNINFQTL